MTWRLVYTRAAQKDAQRLATAGTRDKAQALLDVLTDDPYRSPPPFEKLTGDLAGAFSRRINIQHRLVYQVLKDERVGKSYGCGRTTSRYEPGDGRAERVAPGCIPADGPRFLLEDLAGDARMAGPRTVRAASVVTNLFGGCDDPETMT